MGVEVCLEVACEEGVRTEEAGKETSRIQARWAESAHPEPLMPGESSLSE